MPDHAIGWAESRRRARWALSLDIALLVLSLVGLLAAGQIGWDFVEHIPAADMGTW